MKKHFCFTLIMVVFVLALSVSVHASTVGESLISVDFFNTDVQTAFQDLSYQAGVTILVDDYIQGYVSFSLTDVSVERVIEVICLKGGYGYKEIDEGLYIIGSIEPSNPTFQKHAETRIVKLNYAHEDTVISLLSHYQKYLKAKDGMIVVRAWPNQMEEIISEIEALDIPAKQVLGQVIIAEVTAEAKKELGIGNIKDGLGVLDNLAGGQGTLTLVDSLKIASMLKVLQAEGKATLKASPAIVVPEGGSATISIAKEVRQLVYKTLQNAYTIERMDAATQLTLEILRITDVDEIWMSYEVSCGDISGDFQENTPTVLTRMAKGTVIVANNTAFVIGGLTKQVDASVNSAFPPGTQDFQQDTELLIIILPHIIGSEMPDENQLEVNVEKLLASNPGNPGNPGTSLETSIQESNNPNSNHILKLSLASFSSVKLDEFMQAKGHDVIGTNLMMEGQLNLTPNLALFGATMSSSRSSGNSSMQLNYGGVLLQTGVKFNSPSFYVGFGSGTGAISADGYTYKLEHKLIRVGLDLKFSEHFFAGIGYNYMPGQIIEERVVLYGTMGGTDPTTPLDLSGVFFRIGVSF